MEKLDFYEWLDKIIEDLKKADNSEKWRIKEDAWWTYLSQLGNSKLKSKREYEDELKRWRIIDVSIFIPLGILLGKLLVGFGWL